MSWAVSSQIPGELAAGLLALVALEPSSLVLAAVAATVVLSLLLPAVVVLELRV